MAGTQRMRLYLAGPAGAGKTRVAQGLASRYGFQRIGLGDLVREECLRLGLPLTRFYLQETGDRVRIAADDDAALVALALARVLPGARGVVVDGVRLVAEAEALREAGFFGVGLQAPDEVRRARLQARDGPDEVPRHRTEREAGRVPVDLRFVNVSEDPVVFAHGLGWLLHRCAQGQGRHARIG